MANLQVFIPSYERPKWTAQSVRSILTQTFRDLELVVSDDSKSDRVEVALRQFASDSRFRYVRHSPRMGMSGNWNDCIKSATAEYVALFHDDDIYQPEMVARSVSLLDAHPEVSFVHSSGRYIDEEGNDLGPVPHRWPEIVAGEDFIRRLARSRTSLVVCPTVIVRRSAYERVGLFTEVPGPGNDKEMWVRLARIGSVGFVDEPLILNRGRTGARNTTQLDWCVDTVRNGLEIARLLPAAYGESFLGRMRGQLEYAAMGNVWPLETVAFLILHGQYSEASRSCDALEEFMSAPTKRLCEALADERNRAAATRLVRAVSRARRAVRGARVRST